jgi:hypothetical protein
MDAQIIPPFTKLHNSVILPWKSAAPRDGLAFFKTQKEDRVLKLWSAAIIAAFLLAGCASVTIRPDGGTKVAGKPDYQVSKAYFFWGLAKEHTIDVKEICDDKGVEQIQSQHTFLDGFLGTITLGIYAPKTAKVWCKLEGESK